MDTFTEVITWISRAVLAGGGLMTAWGLVTFGSGLKDQTAPEIRQGIFTTIGGALIVAAGLIIANITL